MVIEDENCFDRILRGDRPYWWIHETAQWKNVTLEQFELTCETGPGKLINLHMIIIIIIIIKK